MNSADVKYRETLFWELAQQLLAEPGVTQSTMMGYRCHLMSKCESARSLGSLALR